jgi:hypothetical protein
LPVGQGAWTFDTSVSPIKTYYAYSQKRFGVDAPDHGVFLNISEENGTLHVEGFDVPRPSQKMDWNVTLPSTTFTTLWFDNANNLVGKINDATFKGIPRGELLFAGFNGRISSEGTSDLTFRFERRRNPILPMTIGGVEIPAEVESAPNEVFGHDVIWAQWQMQQDTTVPDLKAGAKGVYVARVFDLGNFNLLGL